MTIESMTLKCVLSRMLLASCLTLSLNACVTTPEHARLARDAPTFSPIAFFTGRALGDGRLNVLFAGTSQMRVESAGRVEPDGTLVLDQRIERDGEPYQTRTWRLQQAGDAQHYTGTLTTAEGPVTGEVNANELHLRFTAEGGLDTEQWLYLQPGGRVALNRMIVRKFGLPVAALEETIRKED